jgi:hypothetical protein
VLCPSLLKGTDDDDCQRARFQDSYFKTAKAQRRTASSACVRLKIHMIMIMPVKHDERMKE